MFKSKNTNGRFRIFFDDREGFPAGPRIERGEPLTFDSWEWETLEEAEDARIKLEAYYLRNLTKRKK